jgi:DNA-binding NarL/FixJ family response regulator
VPIRVLLIEDDARYRSSIETLLGHTPGFALASSHRSAEAALAWLDARRDEPSPFDLALVDIALPGTSGIDTTRELKTRLPDVAVVMLTVFEEPATVLRAICAGADGYLLKKTSARELVDQLRASGGGGTPMSADVARTVLELVRKLGPGEPADRPSPPRAEPSSRLDLTQREQEVLRCLVRGRSYKQAAADLGISIDTIRTHVRALYKKLQVHSVAEAITRALRDQLV